MLHAVLSGRHSACQHAVCSAFSSMPTDVRITSDGVKPHLLQVSARDYLEEALKSVPGHTAAAQAKNQVRQTL